jgi:hypothetical protein
VSKPKQLPINKRHPGKHVVRLKVWMPDGSSLMLEGPVTKEAAAAMVSAGVNGTENAKKP